MVGSLTAAYWLFTGFGYALLEPAPLRFEGAVMAVLMVASALSVLVAWWREGIGGFLVFASGLAHALFALVVAGHNRGFAVAISGGPYLLAGVLWVISWRRSGARRVATL